jgi:hypothetical protein
MQRAHALGWPVDLLVCWPHNRRLPDGTRLWDQVHSSEPLGQIEFILGARAGRRARVVRQELRIKRVTVDDHDLTGVIEMTCLVASEVGAPAGEKPVCWRLLTNRCATIKSPTHIGSSLPTLHLLVVRRHHSTGSLI